MSEQELVLPGHVLRWDDGPAFADAPGGAARDLWIPKSTACLTILFANQMRRVDVVFVAHILEQLAIRL